MYTTVTFFIHHLIGMDCFLFVAIMNNAAMNVCVQHSIGALLLHVGYIPRSEIVGSHDNSMFNFLRTSKLFCKMAAEFCIHTRNARGFQFLHILINTWHCLSF